MIDDCGCSDDCGNCIPCPLNTYDVHYCGLADACTGITRDTTLTDVLQKLVVATNTKLTGVVSSSLYVTTPLLPCGKLAHIEIQPSNNAGNIFSLGSDGKPYVPTTIFPPFPPPIPVVPSTDPGNIIILGTDGKLFAPPTVVPPAVVIPDFLLTVQHNNTDTVTLLGNGTTVSKLTADVKIVPINTNLIRTKPTGLLVQDINIQDVEDNLKQSFIFEAPVMDQLTYPTENGLMNGTKMTLGYGPSYATNYSANNPDVKISWGDNIVYEQTLDNEIGTPQSLSHNYGALKPYSNNIYLKTYNTTNLTKLYFGDVIASGFKAEKGAELIINFNGFGAWLGTSGVYDFKGFYNLQDFRLGRVFVDVYQGSVGQVHLKNTQDLQSLTYFGIQGIPITTDFPIIFTNPGFTTFNLNSTKIEKGIVAQYKNNLHLDFAVFSTDYLDLFGSSLEFLNMVNCGILFGAYINHIALKLFPPSSNIGYTQGSGVFDFTGFKNLNIFQVNGRMEGFSYSPTPTKIFFPNFTTNNLEYVSMEQDIVKDEAFISFNNNGLINGFVSFVATSQARSFGQNYHQDYYNPTWAPNGGYSTLISAIVSTTGIVTLISGYNTAPYFGYGYNTIPSVLTIGPGSGLVSNGVMFFVHGPAGVITNGGSGYTPNQSVTLSGPGTLVPAVIVVQTVSVGGGITEFYIADNGEYTSLPATLTHSGGLVLNTTNRWAYKRAIITNGGTGYDSTTKFLLNVTSGGGSGTGTASPAAKAAIESLHLKGWQLMW